MRASSIVRGFRAAPAALAAPAVLAALAAATALPAAATARPAAAAATARPAAAAAATATPAAQFARVRIPFPQYDGTLTPYTFELGYPLTMLVYDSLMWRDPQGVPQPWLARSVARRGDTVLVRLRSGVRWQDGVPVTAADVVFTYRYMATHPQPRFTPELQDLVDVDQTGRDTVAFRLRGPSLGFEDQPLADVPIIPQHLWAGLAPGRLTPPGPPVGSGPYRLVSSSPQEGYRFIANDRYFRGVPAVREIDVPIIRDPDTTLNALQNGRIDAVPFELAPDEYGSVITGIGVRVVIGQSYTGTELLLNTAASPFNNPATRRAVAQAISQDAIATSLGGATGRQLVVAADKGLVDPASPWAPRRPIRSYAPDRARVGLVEQGQPPITVLAPDDDPIRLAAGQQVVRQLLAVGARATVKQVSSATLQRDIGVNGYTPNYQAAIWATPNLVSDDPSFLGALFGPPLHSPLNYSGYASSAFDSLSAAVGDASTVAARHRAVDEELALLASDAPAIPLFFTRGAYAFRPNIYDGWVYVKGTGILDKQSFLGTRGARHAAAARGGGPITIGSQDSGAGILVVFGIAIVGLLVLAVAWQLYGRRSTSFRRRR